MPIIRYPPAAKCIYCGAAGDVPLSDEHIIPFALGGDCILPQASCPSCAKITAKIENFCLRSMFGPARILLNMPTRRPKQRPKTLPITFETGGGVRKTVSVPVEEIPKSFGVLEFPPAKIIRGLAADEAATTPAALHARYLDDGKMNALMKKHSAVEIAFGLMTFETLQFSQLWQRWRMDGQLPICRKTTSNLLPT